MSKRGGDGDSPPGAKRLHVGDEEGGGGGGDDALGFRLRGASEPPEDAPISEDTPPSMTAPAFRAVHASWTAFDAALKQYAQATFQLYAIRSTTSVRRRNQRIAESTAGAPHQEETADAEASASSSPPNERALLPEHFEWYSKTLVCTHGWRGRHRGTGKRAVASVRSTSCPARMCVTLQLRVDGGADGTADWQVVVTKHQRQHNHPLSRELYFYYLENRRIYDPELLAVAGDASATTPTDAWRSEVDPRDLLTAEEQPTPSLSTATADETTSTDVVRATDDSKEGLESTVEAADSEFVLRPDTTAMYVMAMRANKKAHESWSAFHSYMGDYSEASRQVFRTRSTISVAAKNAKTVERGVKAGRPPEETVALLIPEELKWYSKMLICNHGWKRKSRRKMVANSYGTALEPVFSGDAEDPAKRDACPATLLVRLERDASGTWRVVINRQVVEHNHALSLDGYDGVKEGALIVQPGSGSNAADAPSNNQTDGDKRRGQLQLHPCLMTDGREVVVRVARLQTVFLSWEQFHEHLKLYSDATFQLYCTRTTTSVVTRNRKIMALNQQLEADRPDSAAPDNTNDTRMIPEEWKWYNKTLMCTHGWKRRPRGAGKRVANVVRSTQCPVKMCATVQYIETPGGAAGQAEEAGGWRVVVTKHILDHNHNLSRALYEHYRENRRIYDPDLLAIDDSNVDIVVKPGVEAPAPSSEYLADPSTSTREIVIHDSENDASSASNGLAGGNSFLHTSGVPVSQAVPSVVILPYQSSLSSSMSSAPPPQPHNTSSTSSGPTSGTTGGESTGSAVATLAALSTPQPQMYMPYHLPDTIGSGGSIMMNPGIASRQAFSTGGLQSSHAGFSLSPGGPYVTIAPSRASSHMSGIPPSIGFDVANNSELPYPTRQQQREGYAGREDAVVDGDADLEPTGGAWALGSPAEPGVPVVNEAGETMWRVAPMARRHADWDAFHLYLDAYSASTLQLFSVRTTTAVRSRNTRILQQIAKRSGSNESSRPSESAERMQHLEATGQILPPKFEWYAKTFLCTHGLQRRRRGIGKRVGHSVRSTQCTAKICATLQYTASPSNRPDGAKKWRVVVTKQALEHNHEVSHAMYHKYSESRRVKDPEVMQEAERLWRSGSSRRQVFEFIKERAPQVPILMKDVHNTVQRWRKRAHSGGLDGTERGGEEGDGEEGQEVSADAVESVPVDQPRS